MKNQLYLKTVTLEEAFQRFKANIPDHFYGACESICVDQAHGRVTAEPIFAKYSNPNFNAAAMDGIMVISSMTQNADERRPLRLTKGVDFEYVDTGDVIVPPYDSVIMIEHVDQVDEGHVDIRVPSHPWEHVRMVGEDFVVGEMLFTRGHTLSAVDLGALVSGGVCELKVMKRLRVGIIPTGTEIVDVGTGLKEGDIFDSNSRMFVGLVLEAGGIPLRYAIVPDNKVLLKEAILKAVKENDMVIINAGSSAGREDFTSALIKELGSVWVHGIDIKPGKPTILGEIDGVPVIGIPGYPVSAYMTFKHFVVPLISGADNEELVTKAVLSQAVTSSLKHKEFVRVQMGYVDGKMIASPLKRGAASTMSLVKANGILVIDKESEGYPAGSEVAIKTLRQNVNVSNGLVSIGSHDVMMDWIADFLMRESKDSYLMSSHVGSLGGLLALKRGEAHMAPIHVLDEATGIYNIHAVKKYLPAGNWVLVKGVKRSQGFYTRDADSACCSFKDIVDRKLRFVNRQNGSGTRLLTDYLISSQGVKKDDILGYHNDVLTHTAVASAVKSGNADVGVGIESVAKLMGLHYAPIATEDYDFLLPQRNIHLPMVKDFLTILTHADFKDKLAEVGGYILTPLEFIEIGR